MPEKAAVDWKVVVERIRQGDRAAEELLYQDLVSGARLFLQRRLGTHDVDDKVHDLFVTLIETIRRGELRQPERLMGFVRTILYRLLHSEVSEMVRRRETTFGIESAAHVTGPAPTPEQQTFTHEKVELMKQVLRELNDRDFEVLSRSYLREQTQEQICADMALTPAQFQLLKSRAKARLSELIERRLIRKKLSRR